MKMNDYFNMNMNKLEECLMEYDSYSELEKLDKIWYIANCFEIVLNQKFVKYYNVKLVRKLHDMILKLDCLPALVRLDSIMLVMHYNSDYRDMLSEDISKNAVELSKKRLNLFITDGLNYQLTIKDGNLVKPFEYNNYILNKYGRSIVKDTLRLLEYLELSLMDIKIDINIVEKLYKEITTEQLAFIYAQLEYCEYVNNLYFEYGSSDSYVYEAIERIFEAMWERSDEEKIKFMKVICELGYCNVAMGVCAMLVELYKTKEQIEICFMLRNILEIRKYGSVGYDIEREVREYLDSSKRIKMIRDEDTRNGIKTDTIYNYSMKSVYIEKGFSYKRYK